MTSPSPRYRGVPVVLAGATYIVPAMTLGIHEELSGRLEALAAREAPSELDTVRVSLEIVLRCLQRNYPEMTFDFLREHAGVDEVEELSAAIRGISGYREWVKLQAELGNPWALQKLAAMAASTGAPSSPSSPAASGGPSSTAATS